MFILSIRFLKFNDIRRVVISLTDIWRYGQHIFTRQYLMKDEKIYILSINLSALT